MALNHQEVVNRTNQDLSGPSYWIEDVPGGNLLDLFCFQSRCILALFVVRVDAEIDLDAFSLGGSFDHAADGRGREALASDERSDIRLTQNETEVHFVFAGVSNPKLGELGVFDEL